MQFDHLLGVIENAPPHEMLVDVAVNGKLFCFPAWPRTPEMPDLSYRDHFHLPFRVTAVEDPFGVVVFRDSDTNQTGLNGLRQFVIFYKEETVLRHNLAIANPEVPADQVRTLLEYAIRHETSALVHGTVSDVGWKNEEVFGVVNFQQILLQSKRKQVRMHSATTPQGRHVISVYGDMLSSFIFDALVKLIKMSDPKFFVVEESPLRIQKTQGKKFPRTHQRPTYTFLTAKQFREKACILQPHSERETRVSPIPHERRAHLRRLSTDGGRFKQDKIVHVRATWVGEFEQTVGNKRYKVLLDV